MAVFLPSDQITALHVRHKRTLFCRELLLVSLSCPQYIYIFIQILSSTCIIVPKYVHLGTEEVIVIVLPAWLVLLAIGLVNHSQQICQAFGTSAGTQRKEPAIHYLIYHCEYIIIHIGLM